MNNEKTNVYEILRQEYKEYTSRDYYWGSASKEISSFLHYNAKNQYFKGRIDGERLEFENMDTGKRSEAFQSSRIYFFPTRGQDFIKEDSDMTAFGIGRDKDNFIKMISVNDRGLFIEKYSNSGEQAVITTLYYDKAAVKEIEKEHLSAGSIGYIEDSIGRLGIEPDQMIVAKKLYHENGEYSTVISVVENEEIIKQEKISSENRTFYSTYYEFMKKDDYYGIERAQDNSLERQSVQYR